MFKPFSLLFFVAVFTWIIRIFLTTDGAERIERTCTPVEIFGNASVSTTALVADQFTGNVQNVMNTWVYGCRYIVWRSFYEKDYLEFVNDTQSTLPENNNANQTMTKDQKSGPAKIDSGRKTSEPQEK